MEGISSFKTDAKEEEDFMQSIPIIDMMKTGEKIVQLRERCGLSVRELQNIFGFATPQAIYKWQHGTALPSVDNLVVLASVFQVQIEEILVVDNRIQVSISA